MLIPLRTVAFEKLSLFTLETSVLPLTTVTLALATALVLPPASVATA